MYQCRLLKIYQIENNFHFKDFNLGEVYVESVLEVVNNFHA